MKIKRLDDNHLEIEFNKTNTKLLAKSIGQYYKIKGIQVLGHTYLDSSYLLILPPLIRSWAGEVKLVRFVNSKKITSFLQDWCIELMCQKLSILKFLGLLKECDKISMEGK